MTDRNELLSLRDAIESVLGFGFEEDRLRQLGDTVRSRIAQLGLTGIAEYVQFLESADHRRSETPLLAELITVTETFFYRNSEQIEAMIHVALPLLARQGKRMSILSAGCASGEEPYSLAIALREALPDFDEWDIQILGVDVNPAMLEKAKRATYAPWALRSTPEPIKERYFKVVGKDYVLSDEIRNKVSFRAGNLARNDAGIPAGFQANIVFCRNVLMYFSPGVMQRTVQQLTTALAPGGYLFLGHAETLRGVTQGFALCHTHDTFYYQKKDSSSGDIASRRASTRDAKPEALPQAVEETSSWFEAIQAATNRVTSLTSQSSHKRPTPAPSLPPKPALRELDDVMELLQRERFTDALELLQGISPEAGAQPDALLIKAVLLTNHGKINEAERISEELFREDDLNAGAHYLKALCREHAGDITGAAEQDKISAHLDPSFAMPRLHAGLMAKRLKDHVVARRELSLALVLLEREEVSRLVLFGGGFSRATLTALCSRELAQLGGGP